MSPQVAGDPLFVKRFEQEAVITRKLQHPNAVRVDDIDESDDGRPFIVMEFIEGKSLKHVIESERPLPVPRACAITKRMAAALGTARDGRLLCWRAHRLPSAVPGCTLSAVSDSKWESWLEICQLQKGYTV